MAVRTYNRVDVIFSDESRSVSDRLGYVKSSYKIRGALDPIRFGEETITELMLRTER